jgi:protein TonB
MDAQTLLQADYIDIIYATRNKRYGGYELRKNYNRRMKNAAALLLLSATALASFSFISSRSTKNPDVVNSVVTLTSVEIPVKPKDEIKVQPPTPAHPPAKANTKTLTPPTITKDPMPDNAHMTKVDDMHNAVAGPSNNKADSADINIVSSTTKKRGTEGVVIETKPAEPLVFVQQMPVFAGDINDYISKRITYPDAARNGGIDGKVLVRFVVNEDGSVTNATVVRGIGGGCDEEALRIVRGMPHWKPGKQNGVPVKVYFTLPLAFVLN